MIIDNEIEGQIADSQRLSKLLERIVALREEKDRLAGETKAINKELDQIEQQAVEMLAVSGLDGVRAAGKSWFRQEWFSVSIPPENRDEVVRIANRECPEYVGVNTSQLKAWLKERRAASGEGGDTLAAGTPFAGLIDEYREVRLSHRTLG